MITSLLLARVLILPQTFDGFTPALDHGSRTVEEWTSRLDDEAGAVSAAWCLYYADDRSPKVVNALQHALATPEAPAAHIPIDAILAEWGVVFEALPAGAFCQGGRAKDPALIFPPPTVSAGLTTDQLVTELSGDAPEKAVPAAVALIARD